MTISDHIGNTGMPVSTDLPRCDFRVHILPDTSRELDIQWSSSQVQIIGVVWQINIHWKKAFQISLHIVFVYNSEMDRDYVAHKAKRIYYVHL